MKKTTNLVLQPVSQDVLQKKYLAPGERDTDDLFARVAKGLAQAEPEEQRDQWTDRFERNMHDGFIPAGRTLSSAGLSPNLLSSAMRKANEAKFGDTELMTCLVNCFVQPVGDTVSGRDGDTVGIYPALEQATETLRAGGGVGYFFGNIRPHGALVKRTRCAASGPVSYMQVYDSSCKTVASAGMRRGAQMGTLNVDHPDIERFVTAKDEQGNLSQFNISVLITDAFMDAVETDSDFDLVHKAKPHPDVNPDPQRNAEGLWIYRSVKARELWDMILERTYDHGDPGVLFIDRINDENNLSYIEQLQATNPCAEQPLPPYGCCCLGSIILTRFVRNPFTANCTFDYAAFAKVAEQGVRMLDNVLDVSPWPLEEQKHEAQNKRRIGIGFLGLGSALAMLEIPYGSEQGRDFAQAVAKVLRNSVYKASAELAKERGSFALYDRDQYLASPFIRRIRQEEPDVYELIAKHGVRNSHLLSIAPTGTIALSVADNDSNGIEPIFATSYRRAITQDYGSRVETTVYDHAYRLLKQTRGDSAEFHGGFKSALELSVDDHLQMLAAVQPYVDASISKTINIPADYPFEDFREVYSKAYRLGLKCVATFRPNEKTGVILSVGDQPAAEKSVDPDRRLRLEPSEVTSALRWPNRPETPDGAEAWNARIRTDHGSVYLSISHWTNGKAHPFECFVMGDQGRHQLGALGKLLSMDLRMQDPDWIQYKLNALEKTTTQPFVTDLPGARETRVLSIGAAIARTIRVRCEQLGFESGDGSQSIMLNALASRKEPKTRGEAMLAAYHDVANHTTGDDLAIYIKEAELSNGQRFPYSFWLVGDYPAEWTSIMKMLSIDARITDPAWIASKLALLTEWSEPQGHFFANGPGQKGQLCFGSTLAYIATLIQARYVELGLLDAEGNPVKGALYGEAAEVNLRGRQKLCEECGATTWKKDGCDYCPECHAIGSCG